MKIRRWLRNRAIDLIRKHFVPTRVSIVYLPEREGEAQLTVFDQDDYSFVTRVMKIEKTDVGWNLNKNI